MLNLTREELSNYTGKGGTRAYIGFAGRVYDVTDCALWQNGNHQDLHSAGRDLTEMLKRAPHGAGILQRAICVGILKAKNPKL